jgi:hypothetical protein
MSNNLRFSRSVDFARGQLPFCCVEDDVDGMGGVSCYHSFRVQQYIRCMIHGQDEYSFSPVSVKHSLMNSITVVHRISGTTIEPRHG